MPASGDFLDSNVLCYVFSTDDAKADRAGALLANRPTISVQVLAEICNVARRKTRRSWAEIEDIIDTVSGLCDIVPLTVDVQAQARAIASRTGYTIYDAQILAAAGKARCVRVWSEDMHHGQSVEAFGVRVEIGNPFDRSDNG
ncbi:PIN domain-containing protein [Novosphingobium sp.]|uniref:PIN domain-containing protein n=1 Tax=Novosphingobium sp. TaxID=1874826 RepID=UPI003341C086